VVIIIESIPRRTIMAGEINPSNIKKVEVRHNGSYVISGNIPLIMKTQVVSEYGEPLTWKKDGEIPADEPYYLCRCGQSGCKPFCDGTHRKINFDQAAQILSSGPI
jgi:CDGSH-type Zn-finger protein